MRSKTITIPGAPVGKGRPRFVGIGRRPVTPEKTRDYEELVRVCWMRDADGWRVDHGPVTVEIRAYYPIPRSAPKAAREQMLSHHVLPTVRPDLDNVIKAVLDALVGHAYTDDKQVICINACKLFAEEPRVEVILYEDR